MSAVLNELDDKLRAARESVWGAKCYVPDDNHHRELHFALSDCADALFRAEWELFKIRRTPPDLVSPPPGGAEP